MNENSLAVSRRSLLVTGLSTGFALAVQPIAEAAIHTDDKGLVARETKIKAADGLMIPAYEAYPEKGEKHPIVLVVQEIFGVHEHIKDMCRRFAKQGYYAIAVELYARQGDVSKITDIQKIIGDVVSKVPDAEVLSDLDCAVVHATESGKGDPNHLYITGFCWGGRIVWLYAAHNPKVKAGGAWYGMIRKGFSADATKNPIDIASTLTVPVIGFYGGLDQGIPQTDVEAMRSALEQGHSGSQINVYPDAGHGFNADYRPSYNAKDAKDAYGKLLAWFKDHR